jgi:hypothetical protein
MFEMDAYFLDSTLIGLFYCHFVVLCVWTCCEFIQETAYEEIDQVVLSFSAIFFQTKESHSSA